jgi:hypothetical protein
VNRLPVVRADAPCFGCAAPCCRSYVVPVTAYDVWRLCRALELPWQEVVEVRPGDPERFDCFRLDASATRHSLFIGHKPSGACRLLVELPGGTNRCGAHAGRPFACRIYPFKTAPQTDLGIDFISHAMCPPPHRAVFTSLMEVARPMVVDELAERDLHIRAVARWDQLVERVGAVEQLSAHDFVEWTRRLYDAVEPLRRGERSRWQLEVERAIDQFPLPELLTVAC